MPGAKNFRLLVSSARTTSEFFGFSDSNRGFLAGHICIGALSRHYQGVKFAIGVIEGLGEVQDAS